MNSREKSTAVIGLGGSGSRIIRNLRESMPNSADYIELDTESEVFNSFFNGYCKDVIPTLQIQSRITKNHSVAGWFDVRGAYSPLEDIPDIFLRNTTRPAMRASFLLFREGISSYLSQQIGNPENVIITSTTFGATGSAWILDMANLVREIFPSVSISLVVDTGTDEWFGNDGRYGRHLANDFWTVREISAEDFLIGKVQVTNSADATAKYIESILDQTADKNTDINGFVEEHLHVSGKRLFALFLQDNSPYDLHKFLESRCYPFSHLLKESERYAIAGLIVARVEERNIPNEGYIRSNGLRTINFLNKNSQLSQVVALDSEGPGRDFIGLALSHQSFGTDEQLASLVDLASEGFIALFGDAFQMSGVARDKLIVLRDYLETFVLQELEDSLQIDYAIRIDIFSEMLKLINQLLARV